MADLYTLWIADEASNALATVTGLTLEAAEEKQRALVDGFLGTGWQLDLDAVHYGELYIPGTDAARRVVVYRAGTTLGEAYPELVGPGDPDRDRPV